MQLGLYRTTLAAARLSTEFKVSRLGKMMNRGMKSGAEGNSVNSRINFTDKERGQPQSLNLSQVDYEEEFPTLAAGVSSKQGKRRTRIDLRTPCQQRSEEVQIIGPSQLEASTPISNQNDTDLPISFGKNRSSSSRNLTLHQTHHEHVETKRSSLSSLGTSVGEPFDKTLSETREFNYFRSSVDEENVRNRSSSSRNPNVRQTHHEYRETKRSSIYSLGTSVGEPFDITRSETREFNSFGSSVNEKNARNRSSSSRNPNVRQTYHGYREAKRSSMSSLGTSVDEPFDICVHETSESNSLTSSVNEKNRKKWVAKVQSADEIEKHEDDMEESNNTEYSVEKIGRVLRPGMVLFKHYIPLSRQVDIVNRCRELGLGPGGFYRPGYEDGAKLRLFMMCLGLDWDPQTKRYGERRYHDNAAPPDIPQEFTSLVCGVIDDSHTLIKRELKILNVENELPAMSPDVCIVNFYTTNGRLGLHQDRDESKNSLVKGLPVVSVSVGDSAEFLYGDQRDVDKAESVLLESGDILIFGGESRHIFHGVKTIIPVTAPAALLKSTKLRPGRLNLTFRKY